MAEEQVQVQEHQDLTQTQSQATQTQTQGTQSQEHPIVPAAPWGRLVPYKSNRQVQGLGLGLHSNNRQKLQPHNITQISDICMPEFRVGRGPQCDFSIEKGHLQDKEIMNISKEHFYISRDLGNPYSPAIIHDLSRNGTFLNGQLIGTGNKRVLEHKDVIALTHHNIKLFIFMDFLTNQPDISIPSEITQKYYITGHTLGTGACGVVKLIYNKLTCENFAIKIVAKKKLWNDGKKIPMNDPKKIMNEVNILKSLNHPFIISTEEIVDTPDAVFIIMELMQGGELFERISSLGQLSEMNAKFVFRQLVLAVKYLHEQGITHRDLKPENVLLQRPTADSLIKITDFGLSKLVNEESFMRTMCGTPLYVAPEVLLAEGKKSYGSQVDIWSLGVILFICLSGYVPFSSEYQKLSLRDQIIKGRFVFSRKHWNGVSMAARELVLKMLEVDSKKRITLNEILNHRWMNDELVINLVNKLMDNANEKLKKTTLVQTVPRVTKLCAVKRILSETYKEEDPPNKRAKLSLAPPSSMDTPSSSDGDDDDTLVRLSQESLSFK